MATHAIATRSVVVPAVPRRRAREGVAALALASIMAGFVSFGVAGLAALACLLAVVLFGGNAISSTTALLAGAEHRARMARREARERALASSTFGRMTLAELTMLVTEIERLDPERARTFDLEELLDRHVVLTLAHERALRAAGMADRVQLERIRDSYRSDPCASPKRLELCERRVECLDACEAVAESFANELAIVADTIRLIAQRVACPDAPVRDELVARQLAELDDVDAAHRELAVLCDEPQDRRSAQ